MIMIVYTKHAKEKFKILREQGFVVQKKIVEETVSLPEAVDYSQFPLLVAQNLLYLIKKSELRLWIYF
jgi:hypothetical protein